MGLTEMTAPGGMAGSSKVTSVDFTSVRVTYVLGVPVSIVNMQTAVAIISEWARNRIANYVCIRDVHGIMQAQADVDLLAIHERAGLVTPDGMPLVWIGKHREGKSVGRVCGADLVDALCAVSVGQGFSHYFYGGKTGVAEKMAANLRASYPGLRIVGALSPPFGSMSKEEDDEVVSNISAAVPNIVWVGLSTPKQEYWMRDHVGRIPGSILIGVGAAFDFHAGAVKRAPLWLQKAGLEWLHRLASEPSRLWRRYLILAPWFVLLALIDEIRIYKKK